MDKGDLMMVLCWILWSSYDDPMMILWWYYEDRIITDLISLSLPWIRGMCVSRSIGTVKLNFVLKLKQRKQRKKQKRKKTVSTPQTETRAGLLVNLQCNQVSVYLLTSASMRWFYHTLVDALHPLELIHVSLVYSLLIGLEWTMKKIPRVLSKPSYSVFC